MAASHFIPLRRAAWLSPAIRPAHYHAIGQLALGGWRLAGGPTHEIANLANIDLPAIAVGGVPPLSDPWIDYRRAAEQLVALARGRYVSRGIGFTCGRSRRIVGPSRF